MSSGRVVALFVDEAWRRYDEDRYAEAVWAAEKARAVARSVGDLGAEIRAAEVEAAALRMQGDPARALSRATWVLSVAQDPARAEHVARADVAREVAAAYLTWVECARRLPEIAPDRLLGVLDAGEAWARAVGQPGWRAGLCAQRARVLAQLGRVDEAVGWAEEAVALAGADSVASPAGSSPTARPPPDGRAAGGRAPGYAPATLRWSLGDLLRAAGRLADAAAQYRAALDDPRADAYDRSVALQGLARCALRGNGADPAQGDTDGDAAARARRLAERAVAEAEAMGDDALCPALDALVAAHRAAGELDAADRAARRYREAAARVGGSYHPYLAARAAVDVALDRGDAARAARLIAAWEPLARALDRARGGADCDREVSGRRARAAAPARPDEPPAA